MIQQSESSTVITPRDGRPLCTQATIDSKQFVLSLDKVYRIEAEKHLLLSEAVLEELLRCDQALVLKNVHLAKELTAKVRLQE